MNYGKIVEDSFSLSWRNKSLWIFGLFAGNASNFNLDIGTKNFKDLNYFDPDSFGQIWQMMVPLIWAVVVLSIGFIILNLICSPALVDAVNKLARGGTYKFWDSYSRGIDFFMRKLGLTLLFFGSMLVLIFVSILPMIAMSILGLLFFIPIFLVGLVFIMHLYLTSERVMVVRDCSIGDSLEESWFLLKKHIGKFMIMTLIFVGLAMGIGLVLGLLALILYLPVNIIVKGITDSLPMMLLLGFIFALPLSVIVSGFSGSFFHSMYTLFYFGLVDPNTPYGQKPLAPAAPQQTA